MRSLVLMLGPVLGLMGCAQAADTVKAEAVSEASAVATLSEFEQLPKAQRTCDAAQLLGAKFLNHETAWQFWRANALSKYCRGGR